MGVSCPDLLLCVVPSINRKYDNREELELSSDDDGRNGVFDLELGCYGGGQRFCRMWASGFLLNSVSSY